MNPSWNDPRIRSRQKTDFVQKFNQLTNPRALSEKKYSEILQQIGSFSSATHHVQNVYTLKNERTTSGKFVLRLVELKSGKVVIPLEEVFDEIERIHLKEQHLRNIAKLHKALMDETNFANGNISLEMVKDFISRCQTCIINAQQKNLTIQNYTLFAQPQLPSPQLPTFPTPISTQVCHNSSSSLANQSFTSLTSTSHNNNSSWMPTFTSTPLATKAANPRIEISSILTFQNNLHFNTSDDTSTSEAVISNSMNQINNDETAGSMEPLVNEVKMDQVKKELVSIEEMLLRYYESDECQDEFIFKDPECFKILVGLATDGNWELKESRKSPGQVYFFNKKTGNCQWRVPDEWMDEIKKRVSKTKILLIENADKQYQEDEENDVDGQIAIEEQQHPIEERPAMNPLLEHQGSQTALDKPAEEELMDERIMQLSDPSTKLNNDIEAQTNHLNIDNENKSPKHEDLLPSNHKTTLDVQLSSSTTEEFAIIDNNDFTFMRPFNTTSSFMAMALGEGQNNDETMDIANFIEQFEDQLDSSFNGENIQSKEVNNEIVIKEVASEELKTKKNQTAKKTVSDAAKSTHYVVPGRKRINAVFDKKEDDKMTETNKRPPVFKHLPLQRFRICLPDVGKLFTEPDMDIDKLKSSIKCLEDKIKASKQQGNLLNTSISTKRKRKRSSKNINNIASTSQNRQCFSSNSSRRIIKKKYKKKQNPIDFPFSIFARRSSTPFIGRNEQLFICLHCPTGAFHKYINEADYRKHIVARHRIVTDDSKVIHEYIKMQRYSVIENLVFHCEACDIFFNDQQISAYQRATDWIMHRNEKHCFNNYKENCVTIIEKISNSPSIHPFLTIKKEKIEPSSDNDNDWNPKKGNIKMKAKKKKWSGSENEKSVDVKNEAKAADE